MWVCARVCWVCLYVLCVLGPWVCLCLCGVFFRPSSWVSPSGWGHRVLPEGDGSLSAALWALRCRVTGLALLSCCPGASVPGGPGRRRRGLRSLLGPSGTCAPGIRWVGVTSSCSRLALCLTGMAPFQVLVAFLLSLMQTQRPFVFHKGPPQFTQNLYFSIKELDSGKGQCLPPQSLERQEPGRMREDDGEERSRCPTSRAQSAALSSRAHKLSYVGLSPSMTRIALCLISAA